MSDQFIMSDTFKMMNKWIIEIIVCSWNLTLMTLLLIKLNCGKNVAPNKAVSMPPAILYSAIASFLGFPICYTIKLIMYMLALPQTHTTHTIKYTVVWFSFAVSRLSFYIFMLSRLYYSFRGSFYQIKKPILYMHIFIVSITPFLIGTMVTLEALYFDEMWYIMGSVACIVILFLGSLHILYAFNMKLYAAMLEETHKKGLGSETSTTTTTTTSSTTNRSTTRSGSVQKREEKRKQDVINMMIKNSMLTGFTIVMFIFIIILYGVFEFMELEIMESTVLGYLMAIAINFASLCIYMSFGVNKALYNKCCARVEGRFRLCCSRNVQI